MTLEEVKLQNDILTYFQHFSSLKFERRIGKEYYFRKENQKTGSVSVNPTKGFFFDHQTNQGGNVYTAIRLFSSTKQKAQRYIQPMNIPSSEHKINSLTNLNDNRLIDYYINVRKIDYRYLSILSQIQYSYITTIKGKKNIRNYFTAGLRNDSGGYNTRNAISKLVIGKQDITSMPGNPQKTHVFEGFIDYLSFLSHTHNTRDKAIILNGTANKNRLNYLESEELILYLDNGPGGIEATKWLLKKYSNSHDAKFYDTGEDYNSWWIKFLKFKSNKNSPNQD